MHIIRDLKKLEQKYADELVVIGVHSAKFLAEKTTSNIRDAILRYDLEHPVINDQDLVVWKAYGIDSWPTVVLIDPDGKYVGSRSGEGIYDPVDHAIATLVQRFAAQGKIDRKKITFVLEKDHRPKSVLSYPGKIAVDMQTRRLFFTDSNHNRVVVSSLDGAIQEVIGEGSVGLTDGDFATARFFRPQGITFDPARNALYVADTENHAIRKIDMTAKKVTTLAGTGKQADLYPPSGGTGRSVSLSSPWDVLVRGNTLYIAMAGTHQLWKLDLDTLSAGPYAGTAREDIQDGPLQDAALAQPSGLATDGKMLFFADSESSAIREADLKPTGDVHTLIGQGLFELGDIDGSYPGARLQHPLGLAYNPKDRDIYIADTYNNKIKRLDPKTQTVTTLIGTGARGMADGPARAASLTQPAGLAFAGDRLYIADTGNHLIRVYDPTTGSLSTLKLTHLDKLAAKTMPAFTGKEQHVAEQKVAPSVTALDIVVQLPQGTKFNLEAPFHIAAASDQPDAVGIGPLDIKKPAARLTIPIVPKSGQATITVDLSLSYCAEGNVGLCYFKEARLIVPVRVAPDGATAPSVTVAP